VLLSPSASLGRLRHLSVRAGSTPSSHLPLLVRFQVIGDILVLSKAWGDPDTGALFSHPTILAMLTNSLLVIIPSMNVFLRKFSI